MGCGADTVGNAAYSSGRLGLIAVILWNWSIAFNQSTIYLNVDAPIFRISWADALDAVCVFACTALILGAVVNREAPAEWVVKVTGLAALVTLVTDVFLF